jgi:hypothetical protein
LPSSVHIKEMLIRDGIFKLLRSPGIDSAKLNMLAARYDDNSAPVNCFKIPTQARSKSLLNLYLTFETAYFKRPGDKDT